MGFEEVQRGDQQRRVGRPIAPFVRPDSGQVEEAPGPSRFIERCGQRS